MASQLKLDEDAPIGDIVIVVICFSPLDGSPNYLAMKDQLDVGSLSRRVTFKPVSARLQQQHSLLPTSKTCTKSHQRSLRFAFPLLGAVQGCHVPLEEDLLG
jgi:hypothetical protein